MGGISGIVSVLVSVTNGALGQFLSFEVGESGELPLEKAVKKFEDGIKLTRGCQNALKEAEQKVEILLQSAGSEELDDFLDDD